MRYWAVMISMVLIWVTLIDVNKSDPTARSMLRCVECATGMFRDCPYNPHSDIIYNHVECPEKCVVEGHFEIDDGEMYMMKRTCWYKTEERYKAHENRCVPNDRGRIVCIHTCDSGNFCSSNISWNPPGWDEIGRLIETNDTMDTHEPRYKSDGHGLSTKKSFVEEDVVSTESWFPSNPDFTAEAADSMNGDNEFIKELKEDKATEDLIGLNLEAGGHENSAPKHFTDLAIIIVSLLLMQI